MDRQQAIDRLRTESMWDVLIVGGGATGLGAAVDAAARGYRTALVEQRDFAQATSSRSTKLVHGGVRYLEQLQWGLVFEALRERNRLLRNAPHLTAWQPFLVPAYSRLEQSYIWAGLKLYGMLAGRGDGARSNWLSRRAVLDALPTLRPARHSDSSGEAQLCGGVRYVDGQFDDARLAVALARTAVSQGAALANYVRVVRLIHQQGRVAGAEVRDEETGQHWEIRARVVINATGIFADMLRHLDDAAAEPLLTYSQGVHLVVDAELLGGRTALVVPRTDDGRVLFAIPWYDKVLLGTTDTPVAQPQLEPAALPAEVDFLLRHAHQYLNVNLQPTDVRSVFVGIRPLLRGRAHAQTKRLSRSHAILVSPAGLVTVTGGKWTTYRRMAETALDRAIDVGTLPPRPCSTHDLRLVGAPLASDHGGAWHDAAQGPLGRGAEKPQVEQLATEFPDYRQRLDAQLAARVVDVVWAARHEMARTVEDVLARRTRSLLLDAAASGRAAPLVAHYLALELGRDEAWQRDQVRAYLEVAKRHQCE